MSDIVFRHGRPKCGTCSALHTEPYTKRELYREYYYGREKGLVYSLMSVFRLFSVVKSTHFDLDLLSPNFGGSQILVVFLVQMNLDVTVFLFDYKERFLRNRGMELLV